MTKLQKLIVWLDEQIAEGDEMMGRLSGWGSIRYVAYRDVKNKLKQLDTEEYCADLTAAGY